jgi:hypothetical protein
VFITLAAGGGARPLLHPRHMSDPSLVLPPDTTPGAQRG